jgi:hypothetical protein
MYDGSRQHAQLQKQWRFGRRFMPIWIVGAALATLFAAADVIWNWGWGYQWRDVFIGLACLALGSVFFFVWNWMFKLLSWFTDIFFGPDLNN